MEKFSFHSSIPLYPPPRNAWSDQWKRALIAPKTAPKSCLAILYLPTKPLVSSRRRKAFWKKKRKIKGLFSLVPVLGVSKGYKWELMDIEGGGGICPCCKWKMGNYVKGICDQKSIEKLSELKLISDDVVTQWRRFPIRNKIKKTFG